MDDLNSILAGLRAGGAMVYPLLALAVIAVVIAIEKAFVFRFRAGLSPGLVALIETYGFAWAELDRRLTELGPRNLPGSFFRVILDNRTHPVWWVESRAGDEAILVQAALARWLWVLETIVTAAPLLGLLGTITGMIRSFKLFGNGGLVDPGGVTGGVAEALVATALGLVVAIAALFVFNYFSERQARIADELERLGTRLVDRIRLDEQGAGHEVA
jgi:biopolymer transport protein ExbB